MSTDPTSAPIPEDTDAPEAAPEQAAVPTATPMSDSQIEALFLASDWPRFLAWALDNAEAMVSVARLASELFEAPSYAAWWEAFKRTGDALRPIIESFPTGAFAQSVADMAPRCRALEESADHPAVGLGFFDDLRSTWETIQPILRLLLEQWLRSR